MHCLLAHLRQISSFIRRQRIQTYILGNVSKFLRFQLIYSIRKFFRIYKFASLSPNILGNLSEFVLCVKIREIHRKDMKTKC